jgi:hypothetical protein
MLFRLLAQDLAGLLGVEALADHLSQLADLVLQAARGAGMLLLLDLREESEDPIPVPVKRLSPYFDSVERGEVVPLVRGADVYGHRRAWLLTGWSGEWPSDSVLPPSP